MGYKFLKIFDHSRLVHILLLGLSFIALIISSFLYLLLNQEVDLSHLKTELMQPTIIYDMDGEEASKISANKTEGVSINQIPEHVIDAVISIEDRRFYEHSGIDYIGIIRAAYENFTAGTVVQGGSTITQQLAKITLLTPEQTLKRKLKEVSIASQIEREYSKDEIMEMYLNQIYFGHGAWGIQNASKVYFGKEIEKVNLSEAALLAGLIHAPSVLDPYKNFEAAKKRQEVVLVQMENSGFITSEERESAAEEEISFTELSDPLKGMFPYYVDQVIMEADKTYGIKQDELLTGGYKIYTELDQGMQEDMEEVYKQDDLFAKGSNADELVQSSAVLLDPKTGGVRALIGGRGEHVFLGYNRATQLKAQPGSVMKPLAVYTPALEKGYKPTDLIKDTEMEFAGGYSPKNYNDQYEGEVPMFEAVYKSKNIPAVWLLNEIGIQAGMDYAEKFGIKLGKNDRTLGLALGGLNEGVSPLQVASAYSVFANGGVRQEAHLIRKIVDASGKEVAVFKGKKIKVTTKEVAKNMTAMLKGVVDYEGGTGTNAKVENRDIAGKTGSTQVDNVSRQDAVKDQWFVGYSPNLVGAVWMGYDKTTANQYLYKDKISGANIVFQEIMTKALQNVENQTFDVPTIDDMEKEVEKNRFKNYWIEQKEKIQKNFDEWINRWKN
ncbi:transglycosylase domain-containing protein [Bacillus sp. E214]|uniref:transglycosylase domain-containing protein n=1 Tax=Bacillus sp. E214 TaxID=2587156 RepID=UPI0011E05892|nr:PBP1A family penicillin-binding protein [Bacillus sp. E214]